MLLLFRYINLKIFILICLYTIPIKAQSNVDFLNSIFNKIYINLSFYKSISYDLKITTLEANNITSTYTAKVTEIYSNDSNYIIYKLNNKQIFFSYSNILGIQRFWLGRPDDLPEIYSKDIDNKILTTAISYSNINTNPLWLNIPVSYKNDQGFLVIQSYSKNLFTNFPKVEFYINKENIPIRILYYNMISSFPILEVLVSDYKKEGKGYIIYKTEYKDNSSKKVTIVEKSNVSFDNSMPEWFESIEGIINSNITSYYNSFIIGIRDKVDIPEINEHSNNSAIKEGNINKNIHNNLNQNNSTTENKSENVLSDPLPSVTSKNKENKNSNNVLLKELDSLNSKPLIFNDSILNNEGNSEKNNTERLKQQKLDSKIKNKILDNNTKVQKNVLNNNKSVSNKPKTVKKVDKCQNKTVKEKSLKNTAIKNTTNKQQTNKKTTIESKAYNNKPKEIYPLAKENNNKNNIKDTYTKNNKELKPKDSTVKNNLENKEKLNNNEVKEKKKNILNNLF